jgi:hypothetical protein
MARYDDKLGLLIYNEQVKYVSTFLTNAAVGAFLASGILPMFEQKMNYSTSFLIGWPITAGLFVLASLNLFRLRA